MKRTSTHTCRWLPFATVTLLALVLGLPRSAMAMGHEPQPAGGAEIFRFTCFFDPGDVPGVNVPFPGECTIVITPSGNFQVNAHAQLPAGFSLAETFEGDLPCFGGTGHVVATKSGEVNATCHLSAP